MNEKRPGLRVRIATVGLAGSFPVAPGTAGSVVGVVFIIILHRLLPEPRTFCLAVAIAVAVIYLVGVWSAGGAEKYFGVVDPGPVVIDEVAGQMVTFLLEPAGGWLWLLIAFILFRFFDVLKPFPARRAEHLPGGWGIMTDDIVAGVYSAIALFLAGLAVR